MTLQPTLVYPLVVAEQSYGLPYLPLGMIAAYLKSCRDHRLLDHYEILPLSLGGPPEFPLEQMYRQIDPTRPGIFLLSCYVWNIAINLRVARQLREMCPAGLIVLGGPEIPKFDGDAEAFLEAHPSVDILVLGEGELTAAELLAQLALAQPDLESVAGIACRRRDGSIVKTASRPRIRDLDMLPSPFLEGEFDPWIEGLPMVPLETNRGCPYGCTYCDWGSATLAKIHKFELQRIKQEIDYLGRQRIFDVFITDANFGIFERDAEIAEALVETRARYGFPRRVMTNYAKNGGPHLLKAIKILRDGGLLRVGIVAIQTTDPQVLQNIRRDNIKTSNYEELMDFFTRENIPMSSDLLIGLPGQTVDSYLRDLQFCFDWKVAAQTFHTSLMPNAPMADREYRQRFAIIANEQGLVESALGCSSADIGYMKQVYLAYQFFIELGMLKYFLYFLQLEHAVPAIGAIRRWLDQADARDPRLPVSRLIRDQMLLVKDDMPDWMLLSWDEEAAGLFEELPRFYAEVRDFFALEYALDLGGSGVDALLQAQQAVVRRRGRVYPYTVTLAHDVSAWVAQLRQQANINRIATLHPIESYPPGTLTVRALRESFDTLAFTRVNGHMNQWELQSEMRIGT